MSSDNEMLEVVHIEDLCRDKKVEFDAPYYADRVLLHNTLYERLFDRKLGDKGKSRPWKRGVVMICYRSRMESDDLRNSTSSTILRLFTGHGWFGLKASQIVLSYKSRRELGVEPGDSISLSDVTGFKPGIPGWFSGQSRRLRFYWNHPTDSSRVSFKLGLVGIFLGMVGLGLGIISLLG